MPRLSGSPHRKYSPRNVALGMLASAVALPLLVFGRPGRLVAVVLAPGVAGYVASSVSGSYGDDFVDGVVAGGGSFLVLLAGWIAISLVLGTSPSTIFLLLTFYVGFVAVIGFPFGCVVGGTVAVVGPSSLPEWLPTSIGE